MSRMMRGLARRARGAVRAVQRAQDLRWRRLPRFTVGRPAGPPTVYYLAPHLAAPSGGVRNIYRHVDTLNAAGVPAAVVHAKTGFRCGWFANDTRVLDASAVTLGPADVLVVPECYGPGLDGLPDGPRVVVFNQGAYHTFDLVDADREPGAPYAAARGLIGLLTVSHDSVDLLRCAFPQLPVHLARIAVDGDVFHPARGRPERRISFLTHRRPDERAQLLHMLRARGRLDGWELTPIAGRSERDTAALMRRSAVFLSFSHREGFGLPPAEAMASGCYVVGYHGQGGREYFDPAYCTPVPDGDLTAYVRAVEEACAAYDTDPDAFVKLGRVAAEAVQTRYAPAGLRDDLLAFYGPLMPTTGDEG